MGTYRMTKVIPQSRLKAYKNLGWQVAESRGEDVSIFKDAMTNDNSTVSGDITPVPPYLCQRGRICRPLGQHVDEPLFQAVDMEYMRSAQFEGGALGRSLRRVEAQFLLYKKSVCKTIVGTNNGREFNLQMLANFDTDARELEYKQRLLDTFLGKSYSSEGMGVNIDGGTRIQLIGKADFWWDVRNDVFFSFDKQFMARIQLHLQASFALMNS